MKDSGFRIRVERQLREAFIAACKEHDIPAAQVLRHFMREYVERYERMKTIGHSTKHLGTGQTRSHLGKEE
ncbi:hypothetical protein SLH47_21115 [Cognatiyoonia sp. IB215182]|nr:hypothetical protein [Cognatiyoonia sp. IB215182]